MVCEHCGSLLIEIDWYGQRLIGCTGCNTWEGVGDVQLDPEDLAALTELVRDEGKNADEVAMTSPHKRLRLSMGCGLNPRILARKAFPQS